MTETNFWNSNRAILLIALLHLALPFLFIVQGSAAISSALSVDDSYYYLQTAWNAARHSMVSFDGLHPTNGVHFLWFSMLRVLGEIVETKESYLQCATALSVVLSCVPYLFIWKLASVASTGHENASGNTKGAASYSLWVASAWFVCCYTQDRLCLSTMESSAHAAIVWATLYQATTVVNLERFSTRRWLVFVALLVANVWARLDSAVISATLFLATAWHLGGLDQKSPGAPLLSLRLLLASAGLIVVGAGAEFAFLYQADQHFLPVSGVIKHASADYGIPSVVFRALAVFAPLGQGVSRWIPLVGVLLGIQALRQMQPSGSGYLRVSGAFFLTVRNLAVGVFLYALMSSGIFEEYFTWYLAPSFVLLSILAPLMLAAFFSPTGLVRRLGGGAGFFLAVYLLEVSVPRRVLGFCVVFAVALVVLLLWRRFGAGLAQFRVWPQSGAYLAAVGLCAVVASQWVWVKSRNLHSGNNLYDVRYQSALWLKHNTAENAVLASWNAGQLGFFSERAVINLDGLINSHQFSETVLLPRAKAAERRQALGQYLVQQEVDYLVDYQWDLLDKEFVSTHFVRETSFSSRKREIVVYRRRSVPTNGAS